MKFTLNSTPFSYLFTGLVYGISLLSESGFVVNRVQLDSVWFLIAIAYLKARF